MRIITISLSNFQDEIALVVKNPPANAEDLRESNLIPGWGRSPGGGHGNPLQYSWLENPWTEEPGGLQSMGSHGVRHDWSDLAHTHKDHSVPLFAGVWWRIVLEVTLLLPEASKVEWGAPTVYCHSPQVCLLFPWSLRQREPEAG